MKVLKDSPSLRGPESDDAPRTGPDAIPGRNMSVAQRVRSAFWWWARGGSLGREDG